ncbi:LiaI-LiaF-like domain-containing protein [Desertibacillus haloalkaliphilus]|uniref:LiaI-LiaF-like domain-containing protein n=1 Tax=Desertibacillus haloalkaliphilus TaxID=1328930 RepID=UPI001C269DB5|nr:DUF5668 domain-containing protein [Desertibacillus haloalkaliphilus]MBU8905071.1 hypothetical protein [Desertibacillus haloalkaliphilus]
MKRQGIFPGILLIAVGLFFFLQQFQLPFVHYLFSWPTILLVVGLAFLFQGYIGREHSSLFPGALLFGFGIHFHALNFLPFWPNHWAMFTLITGLSFILLYSRTKRDGLFPGVALVIVSLLAFFYSGFIHWVNQLFTIVDGLWPLVLIIIGLYLILKKK